MIRSRLRRALDRRHNPSHQNPISRRLSIAISVGGVMNLESERAALMQTSRDWARTAASEILSGPSRFGRMTPSSCRRASLPSSGRQRFANFFGRRRQFQDSASRGSPNRRLWPTMPTLGSWWNGIGSHLQKPPVPSENSSEKPLQCGVKTRGADGSASSIRGTRIRPSVQFRRKEARLIQPR